MTLTVEYPKDLAQHVGKQLGPSDWIAVDQAMIDKFAEATGDHQWIHVDVERAKAGPFGGPIAHGYLTLSLIIPMFFEVLQVDGVAMGVNYGLNKVRFPAPVPAGSRIRLTATLAEVEDISGGVQAVVDSVIEVEGGTKPVCVAQSVLRYYV
jgi:acyl dehydratase